jgi:hypothetical protein
MRIGIVGGLDRNESEFLRIAAAAGHRAEWHTGHVGGQGTCALRAMIERSDIVLIVTETNSHGGAVLARRYARELGRGFTFLRKLGRARFRALLAEQSVSSRASLAHASEERGDPSTMGEARIGAPAH